MADSARSHDHDRDDERAPDQSAEREARSAVLAGGSRAFGTFVARMGHGILPGGTVHPDVASAIGAARGTGTSLPADVREQVSPHVGDPLNDVTIHADANADQLARSVSARAFTTGTDVFFAAGEYQPSSSSGRELLAHELTHVAQQRGAPTSGPMTVSEPGQPMETEADAVAQRATS
jgi:Domain of unknown function (DUF4157)